MRVKNLLFLLLSSSLFAQGFNYERDWGTYFGGTNSLLLGIYEDSTSNISVDQITSYLNPAGGSTPVSYYNQFVTPGGQTFTGNEANNFYGKFSPSGNLLQAEYKNYYLPGSRQLTYFRDEAGNRYDIERDLTTFPSLPAGVWLSDNHEPNDVILSKYDLNNNLQWKTYIPNGGTFNNIEVDGNGNIYIIGSTKWQNLGDPGTFQQNFSMVYDSAGMLLANTYIAKLNPQGQKIWATYTPSGSINGMSVHGNNVYIFGNNDLKTTETGLSTSGTFQPAKGGQFIAKINGNTGERVWGTYYGVPGNTVQAGLSDIKSDETGIYVTGMTFGTAADNYYATEGAYKPHTNDGFDLFITKFNDSGNRVWSTYIGSNGYDSFSGDKGLDVKNGKLIFTGISDGSYNMATPGSYISTKPNPDSQDVFFGILSTDTGHPDFISYYGGTYNNPLEPIDLRCSFSKYSDAFYLFGNTHRNNGYSSPNGYQPSIIYPPGVTFGGAGYIAKFSAKFLAVSEVSSSENLVLYNNPNNGNFSLKGSVLDKEEHIIDINDMSGRLIYSKNINKNKEEHFNLESQLENGNYILNIKKTDKTPVKIFKLIIKK